MAWLDGWNHRLEYVIDYERIGEDLDDFPVRVVVSSGVGRNNFDATGVFDELSTSGTVFGDDFSSGGFNWTDIAGTADYGSGHLKHNASGERARTINNINYGTDWEITYRFYNAGRGTNADQLHMYPLLGAVNNIRLYLRQYTSGDHYLQLTVEGTNRGNITKYNWYNEYGNWVHARLKRQNNYIYLKVWIPPDPEPVDWDIITTCTDSLDTIAKFDVNTVHTNTNGAGVDDIKINVPISNNKKIAMTDYTGINQLPVEIEYWDLDIEKAYLWTKVPNVVSGTDTTIYLYYDNTHLDNDVWVGDIGSSAGRQVWNSNFKFVHHMANTPAGASSMKDSSTGNYNGTSNLTDNDLIVDHLGPGIFFDGAGDYINYGDILDSVFNGSDYTLEALYNSPDWNYSGDLGMVFQKWNTSGGTDNCFIMYPNSFGTNNLGTGSVTIEGGASEGEDTYAVAVMDVTNTTYGEYRQNNVSYGHESTMRSHSSSRSLYAGILYNNVYDYYGNIYELRISDTPRSKAWTDATYYTLFDNLMTVALGGSPPPPVIEPPWQDDWADFYEITVDSDKIDSTLGNFPILFAPSSGTGITNFDSTDLFGALETNTGLDGYTKFMMPAEGDLSSENHSVWFSGNPNITTISGVDCVEMDGITSNQGFSSWDSDDWDFATSDFTLETWVNMPASAMTVHHRVISHGNIINTEGAYSLAIGYHVAWGTGTRMNFGAYDSSSLHQAISDDISSFLTVDVWHHIAVSRAAGVLSFFIDGNPAGSEPFTYDLDCASSVHLRMGYSDYSAAEKFDGYMSRVRVSKGIDRYTTMSGFTPPETYENDLYTKLLYYAQGDQSATPHDMLMQSDPEVQIAAPLFPGTAYWSFDGNDHIELTDHSDWDFGSLDWTIECWLKIDVLGNFREIISKRLTTAIYRWIVVAFHSDGTMSFGITTNGTSWALNRTVANAVTAGEWYHFALTRENNTVRSFLNGFPVTSNTLTGSVYTASDPVVIGAGGADGTYGMVGDIFGMRISKGICRYTENFVPYNPPDGDSRPNRKKIQFADVDHNRLYTEIERWDHVNYRASMWVGAPVVTSGSDTTLYLYYDKNQPDNDIYVGDTGSSAALKVWENADYDLVFHMHQNPLGLQHQSSTGLNHADLIGFEGDTLQHGLTGASYYYIGDPAAQALELTFDFGNIYTIEAFATDDWDTSLYPQLMGAEEHIAWTHRPDAGQIFYLGNGSSWDAGYFFSNTYPPADEWYYSAVTNVTGTITYYLNDNIDGSGYYSNRSVNTQIHIGRRNDALSADYTWDGNIQEFRVATEIKSPSWLKATNYTLHDNLLTVAQGVRPVYTASGTTSVRGVLTAGIPVRLYRRSTGQLVGDTVSDPFGEFTVDSIYNEDHYIASLFTLSGTNAIIYDWIAP